MALVTPSHVTLPFSRAGSRSTTNHHRLHLRPASFAPLKLPVSKPRVCPLRRVRCSVSLPPSKGTGSSLDVELRVRDYEIDQYGVVNNAVYSSYCQHAHRELLESIGVDVDDVVRSGEVFALSEMSLKFIAPLRGGDKFVDRVAVTDSSAARFRFEHRIYKLPDLEPILEAKATVVWLDDNYKPVRIPPQIRSKLVQPRPKLLEPSSSASSSSLITGVPS